MAGFAQCFAREKVFSAMDVSVYFMIILFMHDPLVNLSVFIMNYFTRQVYDVLVGGIALVALAGFTYYFICKLNEFPSARKLKITCLVLLLSLMFIHWQIHFVMNIELIHTVQFGILAILIFPLTGRFGDTAFYTLLFGFADEWFQYRVLYQEKSDYFDFNDLVTNLFGAGFALVILYASGANNTSYPAKRSVYKSPVLYLILLIAAFVTVLFKLSLLRVYGSGEDAWFVLNKSEGPETFWRHLPNSEIVYHVMQPLEGVIMLSLLLLFLFAFDVFARKQLAESGSPKFNLQQRLSNAL